MTEDVEGKRVSWVELYFDLIFVFAVGQAAHVIVVEPDWAGVGHALGLFITLWWTWTGFVVLYNRHGEDRTSRRLFLLAGSLPCAVAAVEMHAAAEGHVVGFTLALAAARLVLLAAFAMGAGEDSPGARRVAVGYSVSTVVFAASAFVSTPARVALWAVALIQEASFLLLAGTRRPGQRRERPARRSRVEAFRAMLKPPADPSLGVDAAHLSERFGLMMIILLGEIVISVGASAVDVPDRGLHFWLGLLAGLILAAALWWIYFTSAAPINEYVLRASGGNPAMAYGLYAGGHLSPAFALLVVAAGVSLALHGGAGRVAAWLVTGGVAGYLVGTRAVTSEGLRFDRLVRLAVLAATVCLAFLEPLISAAGVVAVMALWSAGIAAFVTLRLPQRMQGVAADPLSYFREAG
jgi:low temperature requirement protein LtrA